MDPARVRWWHGALLGVVTAVVALGVAQLVAGLIDPSSAPPLTVGQVAIDATPEWLKAWAIRSLGAADKAVLLGGRSRRSPGRALRSSPSGGCVDRSWARHRTRPRRPMTSTVAGSS